MTIEMKEYLFDKVRANNDEHHNYIFVSSLDNQVEQFLQDKNATITRKSYAGWSCRMDNLNWEVLPLSLGCRGYKPKKLILDMRLSDELLYDSCLAYNLIVCNFIGVF